MKYIPGPASRCCAVHVTAGIDLASAPAIWNTQLLLWLVQLELRVGTRVSQGVLADRLLFYGYAKYHVIEHYIDEFGTKRHVS